MKQLTALENIFEAIGEHDGPAKFQLKVSENPYLNITSHLMIGSFVLLFLILLISVFTDADWIRWAGLISLILWLVVATLNLLSASYQAIIYAREPQKPFLKPVGSSAVKDFDLAESLSQFEQVHLENVLNRFRLEIAQFRSRIALIVGAIEKVGIIPIFFTTGFAYFKFFSAEGGQFEKFWHITFFLITLYMLTIFAVQFIHRLERYALIVETALQIKTSDGPQK